MKKLNIIKLIGALVAVAGFITLGVFGRITLFNRDKSFVLDQESQVFQAEVSAPKTRVDLAIDYGKGELEIFQGEFKEGMTAFDLLNQAVDSLGLNFEVKTYDMGVFIEAIGERKNGEEGKYWLYYVNGDMPQVAADKKEIRQGDRVEFKFEKSSF